jgi:elongation factor Ts
MNSIRELRRRTGAGMMECKKTLIETHGDVERAVEELRKRGITKAEERYGRKTTEGIIGSYVHHNGKLAALVELKCETDFVARTDGFRELARQLAEHVAAAAPLAVEVDALPADLVDEKRRAIETEVRASGKPPHLVEKIVDGKMDAWLSDSVLMRQPWIREPKRTIADLVKEAGARVGEHVQVLRFTRLQMNDAKESEGASAT